MVSRNLYHTSCYTQLYFKTYNKWKLLKCNLKMCLLKWHEFWVWLNDSSLDSDHVSDRTRHYCTGECVCTLKSEIVIWSRAKMNIVLPRKCTGHSKHSLPTKQEKTLHMDITRWPTPKSDWLYSLQQKREKLYTVNKNKTRNWLWLRSWNPYYQIQTQIEESRENR